MRAAGAVAATDAARVGGGAATSTSALTAGGTSPASAGTDGGGGGTWSPHPPAQPPVSSSSQSPSPKDDSGDDGTSGSVFVEGAFGKLSMGDVDGAAKAAVGHVSGVGLTGLDDLNESTYLANVGPETPGALYENSFGDFTFYASADRPNVSDDEAYALGMSYGFGNYTVAAGYETTDGFGAVAESSVLETDGTITTTAAVAGTDVDHWVLGATAAFGDATVKATYGSANGVVDDDQWALSVDYVFGMTTVTAFYKDAFGDDTDAYGIGAAYDLGGGASLKGGIVDGDALDDPRYDFGLSMTF